MMLLLLRSELISHNDELSNDSTNGRILIGGIIKIHVCLLWKRKSLRCFVVL
jgi:hypothetical protein